MKTTKTNWFYRQLEVVWAILQLSFDKVFIAEMEEEMIAEELWNEAVRSIKE